MADSQSSGFTSTACGPAADGSKPVERCRFGALARCLALLCCLLCTGCAAFRSLDGVDPECVPQVLNIGNRSDQTTIDLALLRRNRPPNYLIDTGDVLSVYIEGGLFDEDISENALVPPPVNFPQNAEARPSLGYPVTVDQDGMISLPLLGRVYVRGQTLAGIQQTLGNALTGEKSFVKKGQEQIVVSLQQPRSYRVLVIRQESGNDQGNRGSANTVNFETDKRGTGRVVQLPAYQNDVLHALAETGGLPGLDAENAIYIIRRQHLDPASCVNPIVPAQYTSMSSGQLNPHQAPPPMQIIPAAYQQPGFGGHTIAPAQHQATQAYPMPVNPMPVNPMTANNAPLQYSQYPQAAAGMQHSWPTQPMQQPYMQQPYPQQQPTIQQHPTQLNWPDASQVADITLKNERILRIPVRVLPGEQVAFNETDVTLYDGDIVFIESREKEFFFTGGLLGGGQFNLPRDYDLDVLGALALIQTRSNDINLNATKAVGGLSVLNQDVSVGASKLFIFRQLPQGGRMPIEVDLYDALKNPHERIFIQPGDYLILKYTKSEACAAFLERHILEGAIIGGASSLISN